jgi:hypothetical protein
MTTRKASSQQQAPRPLETEHPGSASARGRPRAVSLTAPADTRTSMRLPPTTSGAKKPGRCSIPTPLVPHGYPGSDNVKRHTAMSTDLVTVPARSRPPNRASDRAVGRLIDRPLPWQCVRRPPLAKLRSERTSAPCVPRVAGLWASRQEGAIRHECRSLRAPGTMEPAGRRREAAFVHETVLDVDGSRRVWPSSPARKARPKPQSAIRAAARLDGDTAAAVFDDQLSRAAGSVCAVGCSRCCSSWWRDLTPSLRNAFRRW